MDMAPDFLPGVGFVDDLVFLALSVRALLRETDPAHGIVLTDDYNPVEFRDAANREAIRKNLARSIQTW